VALVSSGDVVSAQVNIVGEDCRLTVRLTPWENPELETGPDANWVVGEVELTAGSTGAKLQVDEVRTDQSYLTQALRDLDTAIAAFGVRGSAY
jgi:hypothetical protein